MTLKRFLLILIFLCSSHVAWASRAVTFPSVHQEDKVELPLRAAVLKRVFLVRAMAAGVYFVDGESAQDFLKDVSKRIEIEFFVHISQKDFVGYVRGKIWDNVTREEFYQMQDRLQRMDEFLFETKPYDRYAITYTPGVGTRFEYNGKVVGTIEGEDFARGIFSVWLGEHPMDRWLKHQILEKFKE